MKKNDLTVKVKLELPKEVITNILNKGLSRFEEAKYLLLAHYHQHQYFIVGVKEMNKFLGIKDAKGRNIRINMIHWNIITPTESAKVKRNNKGQFFKKGYDIYQPVNKDEMIEYIMISDDARALIGTHSGYLLDALNLVAEKANANDIKQYENQKAEFKTSGEIKITDDLKAVLSQELESKSLFSMDEEIFDFEKPTEELKIEVETVEEFQHVGIPTEIKIENTIEEVPAETIKMVTTYDNYIEMLVSKGYRDTQSVIDLTCKRYINYLMPEVTKQSTIKNIVGAVNRIISGN